MIWNNDVSKKQRVFYTQIYQIKIAKNNIKVFENIVLKGSNNNNFNKFVI